MDPARDRLRFLLDTATLDNLDRADRLELLSATSDDWIAARTLRNRMVHEHIRLPELLAQSVNEAHTAIPMLVSFVHACHAYAAARGLVAAVDSAGDSSA